MTKSEVKKLARAGSFTEAWLGLQDGSRIFAYSARWDNEEEVLKVYSSLGKIIALTPESITSMRH